MGINEMEFQWRLNWWYRPTQLDDFGTSVADYYDCFIDWKANMELNSCPADEADYVAAFVQNLRCDIRSRLSKYNFTGGLIFVFLAAKFEESMMRIDEAFKKNGADKPIDEMPSQDPSCSNGLANSSLVMDYNELSVLEDDESLFSERGPSITNEFSAQIDVEKETHKLFDGLPEPILDQVLGNVDYDPQAGTSTQDIGDSETHALALEALSWLFEEDEHSPTFKLEGTGNAHHLFDESPTEHSLDQTIGYPWGPVLLGYEVWQPHFLVVKSVNANQLIEKVSERFPVEQRNGSYIHVKLVLPFSIISNSDLKDDATQAVADIRSSKWFNAMVVFTFDPGGSSWSCKGFEVSTSIASKYQELDFDLCDGKVLLFTFASGTSISLDIGATIMFKMHWPYLQPISFYFWPGKDIESESRTLNCDLLDSKGMRQYWDELPSTSIAELRVGQAFKLIFDPGGLNALNNVRAELCWTDLHSRHKNNWEFSAFGECKNVLYFPGYDPLFLYDPGGSYYLLRTWKWNGAFQICKEHQGHNMMRENDKYVVFSFDPGGNTFGNTSGYQNVILQEVAQHVEPLVVGLNGDRLLGSMPAFGPEMVCQRALVQFWELREIKGAPIVISIAHFSKKIWGTISGPIVKGSSAEEEMEDCRLSIMYVVLDLLRPGKSVLVLLLSELQHSKLYLSSNGYDGATATMAMNGVSAHDNVHNEFLACTSVYAFRSMRFDCEDKFSALSLILVTMQTGVFSIFVWDPGLCAITAYILMDKAGFEMHNRCENFEFNVDQEDCCLNEKTQSCTTVVGSHRWDVNVCLLVSLAARSAPAWLALHNIDVTNALKFVLVIAQTEVYILADKDDFEGEGKMMRKIKDVTKFKIWKENDMQEEGIMFIVWLMICKGNIKITVCHCG